MQGLKEQVDEAIVETDQVRAKLGRLLEALKYALDEDKVTARRQIVALFVATGAQELTYRVIAERLRCKRLSVARALGRLVNDGLLERPEKGLYRMSEQLKGAIDAA